MSGRTGKEGLSSSDIHGYGLVTPLRQKVVDWDQIEVKLALCI